MKINAKVIAVETSPGSIAEQVLIVRLTGYPETQAEWKSELDYRLEIPNTPTSRRAYYIGREVTITLEPQQP